MLTLFILYITFHTLRGAPVGSALPLPAGDAQSMPACQGLETQNDAEYRLRTKFAIMQSCLLTIFACVWKAMHPNINGPKDSHWRRFKRKLLTTLYALIAPEMVLYWALAQCSAAKDIARRYNKEFSKFEATRTSFTGWFLGLFRPLSDATTLRGDGQRWTTTHGFFIQMGGFMLYKDGYPTEVLNYEQLAELLRRGLVDQPTVTARELRDRSKGDAISKGLVVWQTAWFAFQCCARLARHLPLSELEVITLAFTVVNFAIYAAWWDKPQSVDTAVRMSLKGEKGDHPFPPSPASAVEAGVANSNPRQSPSSDKTIDDKYSTC